MSHTFRDPRTEPCPPPAEAHRPDAAAHREEVQPLLDAIRAGRVFEVEAWVRSGKPIQARPPTDKRGRRTTALEYAIAGGRYDAIRLLLWNGYHVGSERRCPYTVALGVRRHDVVKLLFQCGIDPGSVCPRAVVESRSVELMEEFWRRGVDLEDLGTISSAVCWSPGNRQLFGFLKRHAQKDPRLQRALNLGLFDAVERNEEPPSREKAVSMAIWAGADPWASNPYRWCDDDEEDLYEEGVDPEIGDAASDRVWRSAVGAAVRKRRTGLLQTMRVRAGPRFQNLYSLVEDRGTCEALIAIEPPRDRNALVGVALHRLTIAECLGRSAWTATWFLEYLFEHGARLTEIDKWRAEGVRRYLCAADAHDARRIVRLLQDEWFVEQRALLRILASPKLIAMREALGLSKATLRALAEFDGASSNVRRLAKRAAGG